MRLRVIGLLLVVLMTPAWADSTTKVFPLTGNNLGTLNNAPERLTRALATQLQADVGNVPIEDAAGLLECDVENSQCLDKIAKSMNAERLVFGTVVRSPSGVRVTLTRFDVGPSRNQRTFELTGTIEDFEKQLISDSVSLFDEQRAAPQPVPSPTPNPGSPPPSGPTRFEYPGRITASTWLLLGAGVVTTAIGGGFFMSGRGYREDVANAPTDTREDFDRLIELEETGRFRTRLGVGLMVGGGAIATIAIVRAVIQRKAKRVETLAVHLDPVPIASGAAIVLTVTR